MMLNLPNKALVNNIHANRIFWIEMQLQEKSGMWRRCSSLQLPSALILLIKSA